MERIQRGETNDMEDLSSEAATWLPTTLLLGAACSLFVLMMLIIYKDNYTLDKNLPPGSFGWPIIGETAAFIIDGKKFMKSRLDKYGPVFKTSILGFPMIVISGSQNVRPILTGERHKTVAMSVPRSVRALFGKHSLCTSTGHRHQTLHRAIIRAFGPSTLHDVTPFIHDVIRDSVAKWRQQGHITSAVDEFTQLSFMIATKVLLALNFDECETKRVKNLFDTFNDAFFSFPVNIPGFTFRKGMKARRQLIDIITNRTKTQSQDDVNTTLLMNVLKCCNDLKKGTVPPENTHSYPTHQESPVVPEEFQDLALELVYGGFKTTASTMCAIAICLAENPDAMKQVRQELEDLNLVPTSPSELHVYITYSHAISISSVNNVMKEVLRIMPPIAGAFRQVVQPMEIMGYHIPEGWHILYTIPTTHHLSNNPRFKKDVFDFKPDRWDEKENKSQATGPKTNENASKTAERFEYIPFGGGFRSCVGKEFAKMVLRVFIIEMVRTSSWTLVNGTPEMHTAPFPFPKDDLPLKFENNML